MAERASTSAKKLTDDSAPATFSSAQKTFQEEPPERRNSRGPLWAASIGLGEPTEAAPGATEETNEWKHWASGMDLTPSD